MAWISSYSISEIIDHNQLFLNNKSRNVCTGLNPAKKHLNVMGTMRETNGATEWGIEKYRILEIKLHVECFQRKPCYDFIMCFLSTVRNIVDVTKRFYKNKISLGTFVTSSRNKYR